MKHLPQNTRFQNGSKLQFLVFQIACAA